MKEALGFAGKVFLITAIMAIVQVAAYYAYKEAAKEGVNTEF